MTDWAQFISNNNKKCQRIINYAGDSSLQNVYLAVMGAVEIKTTLIPFGVDLRECLNCLNKTKHSTHLDTQVL